MEIKGDSKVANPNEWVENDEIPDCLKKLTKIILRAFYSPEHSLGKFCPWPMFTAFRMGQAASDISTAITQSASAGPIRKSYGIPPIHRLWTL